MPDQPDDRAKRAFDVIVAAVLLVITLPIQSLTGLAIRVRLGSPVRFRQNRAGLHGKPFEIVKFRTMLDVDPELDRVDDASATSLDELPTLWNIIRGDMSLVGPRPLLMQYVERYSPQQARRHEVRPGLTGLAQVSGRNTLSWEDKFRLDVDYVDRHSLVRDLGIICGTVTSAARRDGIAAVGEATMPEFLGTDKHRESA